VSPRKRDPRARTELIDIAARLLAQEGPTSLSTRRVAAEAGTSTMAVYTHFGSMSGLVREIAHEGFARLEQCFAGVAETDDPVADIALYGRAYRYTAVTNPHMYAVMFGGASLAGFELTESDRQYGRYTMAGVVGCARRCVEADRFLPVEPTPASRRSWSR
jgi:AcrR family transcriptional regulator